jgi:hypothetical protein
MNQVYENKLKQAFIDIKEAMSELEDIASAPHASLYDLRETKLKFNKAIILIQNACEDAKLIKY